MSLFVEVISGLLVIVEGPHLQILSLRLFRLLVREFGGVAPFPLLFILLDLLVRLRDRGSLDDDGRSKQDPPNGVAATGAKGQFGFGDPLDHFETRTTLVTTFLGVTGHIDVNGIAGTLKIGVLFFNELSRGKPLCY